MASTLDLINRLTDHHFEYVIVGGVACVMHGCSLVTEDLDVCAPLNLRNMQALLAALDGLDPRWRSTPRRPPLTERAEQLVHFKNLYLVTELGILDILGEVAGFGSFEEVASQAVDTRFGEVRCRVLNIDALIHAKRSLGRPRDLRAAIELDAIRQQLSEGQRPS